VKPKPATLILTVFAVYLIAYLGMSVTGSYMPFTAGTNGIKSWVWAPRGIVDETGRFRRGVDTVFYPLLWLDFRFWHSDWTGSTGPYKNLKPPAWRLGLRTGTTRDTISHQLQSAHATIVSNTPELLRAEYKTEDSGSLVQVEVKFGGEQATNIHYYFH
jgi:hypothetical protein